MLRILVCGDRNWDNFKMIYNTLAQFSGMSASDDESIIVIDGTCRGADALGNKAAKKLGFKTKRFAANWDKYYKAAGPIRNQQMLDEGKPNLVLAFHTNLANSKGTKDMLNRARKAGIPTCIFPQKKPK